MASQSEAKHYREPIRMKSGKDKLRQARENARHQARENARHQAWETLVIHQNEIGFTVNLDWLKKWREFSWLITPILKSLVVPVI